DAELASSMRELLELPGTRLFQFVGSDTRRCNLDQRRLNAYIKGHLGEEFSAKDFRPWGGTLLAAIELARRGPSDTPTEAKRRLTAVMRTVAAELGNTPAVARSSYVSPAVIEQYLDGRTIADFRPRHLRVVGARDKGLSPEEQATLSLLRSWRLRASLRKLTRNSLSRRFRNGSENDPCLRQLRKGSRRVARRQPAHHVCRRAPRLEGRRSL